MRVFVPRAVQGDPCSCLPREDWVGAPFGCSLSRPAHPLRPSKTAVVFEACSGVDGEKTTAGAESGPKESDIGLYPATPRASGTSTLSRDALVSAAAELRKSLTDAVGEPDMFVAVGISIVRAGSGAPWEITTVRVGAGHPELPRWSRAVLAGADAMIDAGSREAILRALGGLYVPAGAARPSLDQIVAVDAYAAADLVRAAAARWMALRAGTRVAGPAVAVDDPGWWPAGPRADAAGDPPVPLAVVRDGRLFARPRGRESAPAPPTGSLLFDSWRKEPRLGWRTLRLRVGNAVPWPRTGAIVQRVVSLGDRLFAAGTWWSDGRQTGAWGPIPVPSPGSWLERIEAACGVAAFDADGVLVEIPPLMMRWGAGDGAE